MKAGPLSWGIAWRVTLSGLGGGAVLGGIYGPLSMAVGALLILLGLPFRGSVSAEMVPVWLVTSCLVGMMLGGLAGLLIGLADALMLIVTTVLIPHFLRGMTVSRWTLSMTSATLAGLGAFLFFMWSGPPVPTYQGSARVTWLQPGIAGRTDIAGAFFEWLLWVVVPALIAAGYGWWVGSRTAMWVAHQNYVSNSSSPLRQRESAS
jgi:hypothetical protein